MNPDAISRVSTINQIKWRVTVAEVSEIFDLVAAEYDFAASLEKNYDFFLQNLSTYKGAALDIGCGSGILALELSKHYESVVGVDSSDKMLAIARLKRSAPNILYLQMDANQLSRLNKKFELIVSAATLHHLEDISATLKAIKDLLNPSGKIVLLDNISEIETPATIGYIAGAVRDFLPDCFKYGVPNAARLFRFRTSPNWLKHLASDRYLSENQFKEIYRAVFPGCSFVKMGCFMGVIWENL